MRKPLIEVASGDIVTLQFELYDTLEAVVNLAAYTEIAAKLFAVVGGLPSGAAVKTCLLADTVDLVGGGTTGLFSVGLVAVDTASLSGDHWLECKLTDAAGNFRHTSPVIIRILADTITT